MGYIHEPFHRLAALHLTWNHPGRFGDVLGELMSFSSGGAVDASPLAKKYALRPVDASRYKVLKDAPRGERLGSGHFLFGEKTVRENGSNYSVPKRVFYDAPYAFVLVYDCGIDGRGLEAIACTSFRVDGFNSVRVMQLQGRKGKQDNLRPVRWEKMLIGLVDEWAKGHGADTIKIRSSGVVPSMATVEVNGSEVPLRQLSDPVRRYDMTAVEMGFTRSRSGRFYYRPVF